MNKYQEKQKFLNSVSILTKEIASFSLTVEGSENINDDTALEILVANEVGTEEKLKKLSADCGDLFLDGYVLNKAEDAYKIIYCQKSPERKLKDELFTHLVDLGFLIKEVEDTTPNKGLLFSVKTKDEELLKKLDNFKTLIFDGYTDKTEGMYDVVYIFPKED